MFRLSFNLIRQTGGKQLIRPPFSLTQSSVLTSIRADKNLTTLIDGTNSTTVLARVSSQNGFVFQQKRYKKRPQKSKRAQVDEDEESDSDDKSESSDSDEEDDELSTGDYVDKTADVNSMRFDVVAKAGKWKEGVFYAKSFSDDHFEM